VKEDLQDVVLALLVGERPGDQQERTLPPLALAGPLGPQPYQQICI
jgi:hypothetical protein